MEYHQELFTRVDSYIDELFAPHDEVLTAAQDVSSDTNAPAWSISRNQGKLLYIIALLCNARQILEIGTLHGYSAIWMARALPPGGSLISIDANPTHAARAREHIARAGLADRIEVRVANALEALAQLAREEHAPFDMVFIDADKPPYPEYLRWALRLTRPGGVIVADNVIRHGEILEQKQEDAGLCGIQQFNTMLAQEPRVAATLIPMVGAKGFDGLAIAVVRHAMGG